MNDTLDKDMVKEAMSVVQPNGKRRSFSQFLKDHGINDKSDDRFKWARNRYNDAEGIMRDAQQASKLGNGQVAVKVSLTKASGHKVTERDGVKEGSVFHVIAEERRIEAKLAFLNGWLKQYPREMGLTDAEFLTLSKNEGLIPETWKRPNSKGVDAFTKAACEAWLNHYKSGIYALKQAAKDAEAAALKEATQETTETASAPAETVTSRRRRNAA
jgi:hypothetical protein